MKTLDVLPPEPPIAARQRGRPRVSLDPDERSRHIRCAVYRLHDGMSIAQVAELMGISPRTVQNWTELALGYFDEPECAKLREIAGK